ncbi:MAG: YidC/Oxa1 family membrane protein insertase [Candidatus Pacebacteria bacterium]|nr:YidC/Oxa1 family membrane protein insertase [Candidatus Paceibacterota bacterium]
MNFIIQFFYTILYQPLFNGLILLYNYFSWHDLGIAVVLLTLIIKLLLHPLTIKGLRSQKAMADLQPKIKELQAKYKTEPQKQNQAVMELYKTEKVNPFSGCLLLLLQLPILIALYQVFLKVLNKGSLDGILYKFVNNPGQVNTTFFWIVGLNNKIFIGILAVLAGLAQYWQTRISSATTQPQKVAGGQKDFSNLMQKQMLYFFPVLGAIVVWQFGAVIGLYWVFNSIISIIEQMIINKKTKNI